MNLPAKLQARLSAPHLPALDGLRAVAVFLVIFYHFGFDRVPGAHGVMIFFVLSGFLITWLLLKEDERDGDISLRGFYRRRILRIFPAFYAYWILLVALLLVTGRNLLWPHAWSSFFYVSNYYIALNGDPGNGFSHTWSLAIEEQFYLLWPFIFLLWRRSYTKMVLFLASLIGAVWIYRVVLCYGLNINQAYIYAAFDTRLDELMVGCLLAVVLKKGMLASFWRKVTANEYLPLVTLALLICSIFVGNAYVYRYRDVFGFALEPLLIALLIVQLMTHSSARLWSWTEWRVMKFLGRISYSLYLYQQLVLHPARQATARYPVVVQLIVAIVATIIVASLSYYLIERPFLKLKDKRFFARRRQQQVVNGALYPGAGTSPTHTP